MSTRDDLVSVIVPTRNSARTLGECLQSVRDQTHQRIELVVVDRQSDDDTKAIASGAGAVVLDAGPERSAQRNVGASAASGARVLFVDSDMVLERDVVERCVRDVGPASAGIIAEVGVEDRFFTRVRSLEKRIYAGNDAVEAARLFPREAFLALGGFDEALSAAEDWDLTDRWRAAGGIVERVGSRIVHNDRDLTLGRLLRKRFSYGRRSLDFLRKEGVSGTAHLGPGRLRPLLQTALRQPLLSAALVGLKGAEAVSFGAGVAAAAATRPEDEGLFGRTRRCAELLERSQGRLVLDVGCSGAWLSGSVQEGRQYVGVDTVVAAGSGAAVATASALALPVTSGCVDVVAFFDVLEHLPRGSERAALVEIRRVLRDGGTLLLSTPNQHALGTVTDPAWWLAGHRHYRLHRVIDLLMSSGFEVRETALEGGPAEALYLPFFYLFKRLRLRLPAEAAWKRAIDREYGRPGWYTMFASAVAVGGSFPSPGDAAVSRSSG